jgi:hypothetical protein
VRGKEECKSYGKMSKTINGSVTIGRPQTMDMREKGCVWKEGQMDVASLHSIDATAMCEGLTLKEQVGSGALT